MDVMPIGVFASAGDGLGASLEAVRRLGVKVIQLGSPRDGTGRARVDEIKQVIENNDLTLDVVFCGFTDSSYETLQSVEWTVGLAPKSTRQHRVEETRQIADFAKELGCDAIGMHLGVIPRDQCDANYRDLIEVVRQVCDYCAGNGQRFHLETGQETAQELLEFIQQVERDNLFVNFDPANFILYQTGQPLEALDVLAPYVQSVHCKDAKWEREPDQKWYEDCPLGEGDVNVEAFVAKLYEIGYRRPLIIEREYSPDQEGDLVRAIQLLEDVKSRILAPR
jgi:sugar phosphate isomerase/epimerase